MSTTPLSTDLKRLDRQTVLVRSSADTHNPPVGMRGWIHVAEPRGGDAQAKVEVVLDFPDMFNEPAHARIIVLGETEVEQLLASERNGAFALTLDQPLNP